MHARSLVTPKSRVSLGYVRRVLDDTIDELRSVALGAADGSGYFPAMYARVTDRIRMAASGGRFGDSEGMAQFALAFARRYLDPKSGATSVPRCWQATWDVRTV